MLVKKLVPFVRYRHIVPRFRDTYSYSKVVRFIRIMYKNRSETTIHFNDLSIYYQMNREKKLLENRQKCFFDKINMPIRTVFLKQFHQHVERSIPVS